MTNKEYMDHNKQSFKTFLSRNYEEFKKDKGYMLRMLEYTAHNMGAGIQIDGTEHDVISGSYSNILVSAFLGTSIGIPVDAKTWNGWIYERLGAAYETLQTA